MTKQVAFLFSGQGSQYYHMGKTLMKSVPLFQKWMVRMDKFAVKKSGKSIIEKLYHEEKKASDSFHETAYTHPAIFMVEYALSQVLLDQGIIPDYIMGSSLGEFAAVTVAAEHRPEDILELVIEQASTLETYCEKGTMLAVLAPVEMYYSDSQINHNCELAMVLCDSHFVVTGRLSDIHKVKSYLKNASVLYQELPITQAFHSSIMNPAEEPYFSFLQFKSFNKLSIPLISGLDGEIRTQIPSSYFWDVIREYSEFPKGVHTLERLSNKKGLIYIELGPSGTLTNFVKRIYGYSSLSETLSIMSPFHNDQLNLNKTKLLFSDTRVKNKERVKKMKKAYVFPGQGSQYKGMGADLFDAYPEYVKQADEILGYSIKQLCIEDPKKQLGQTHFTQPALYVVNALSYIRKLEETGESPDYVAGHSLGEYSALFAANAFDFESGLRMVKKRGELMKLAAGGAMAAVIGITAERVQQILIENEITTIDIANINSPMQTIISGLKEDISKAEAVFLKSGVPSYIPLNVSGAFHSRYMEEARTEYESFVKGFHMNELKLPVIANIDARPYLQEDITNNLSKQIIGSVKWNESIRYLLGKGVDSFEEVGPGNVLTKLIETIRKDATPLILSDEEEAKDRNSRIEAIVTSELIEKVQAVEEIEGPGNIVEKTIVKGRSPNRKKGTAEKPVGTETTETCKSVLTAEMLGSKEFRNDYQIKYAYVAGGMHEAISSKEMVIKLGNAGFLGYFGTAGLSTEQIKSAIMDIQKELGGSKPYGINMVAQPLNPKLEEQMVDLFLSHKINNIEVSGFITITPALVRFRLKGLKKDKEGTVSSTNKILAKVSRPETAEAFLSPVPQLMLQKLLSEGHITSADAELLSQVPMADDICAVADSGGLTEQGSPFSLLPVILQLRDEMMRKYKYAKQVRVGAAGGIGTPEAAAAAFTLGADFILTGSINQCTPEAGTSKVVKDMLSQMNIQDTEYAPSEEMFELGAKVQVLKKGVFFPARANKLFQLYRHYNSIQDMDGATKQQLQSKYFQRSFDDIFHELSAQMTSEELSKANQNPKHKMAVIFKWYLKQTVRYAISASSDKKIDYQIYCGSALGAFNQWVKGTSFEKWENRQVDKIAEKLMDETALFLQQKFSLFRI